MARVITRTVFSSLLLGACLCCHSSIAQPADAALAQDRLLLQLLSCQLPWSEMVSPSLLVGQAMERMEALGRSAPSGGVGDKIIEGPLNLYGACLQKVHFTGAAGSFWVSGQICQQGTDDFLQVMHGIGVQLNRGKLPPVLSSLQLPDTPSTYWRGSERQFYLLVKGKISVVANGLQVEAGSALSFFCMLRPPAEYEQR